MIEVTKENCNYSIFDQASDLIEGWQARGNATKEASGAIYINLSLYKNTDHDDFSGSYSYQINGSAISANYSCTKENKENFISYAESLVEQVLTKISE